MTTTTPNPVAAHLDAAKHTELVQSLADAVQTATERLLEYGGQNHSAALTAASYALAVATGQAGAAPAITSVDVDARRRGFFG